MDAIQAAVDALQTRDDALATREKEMDAREAAVKEREDEATEREQAIAVAVADLETREAALVAEREAMDVRLAAFEKQEELKIYLPDSDIITLNVGGEYFTTYLSTMQKAEASMLGTMFSGRFDMPRDEHGRYFIDRPGKPFAVVLDLLRGVDPDFAVVNLVDKYSGVTIEAVTRELEYYQLSDWTGSEAESAALATFADQCTALDETEFTAIPQAGLFKWWKDAGRPDLGQRASTRFSSYRVRPLADLDGHDPLGTIDDVDALAANIRSCLGTRPSVAISGINKNSYSGQVTGLNYQVRSTTLRSLVDDLAVAWKAGRQGETVWWEGETELWQRHGFCILVPKGNLGASAYVATVLSS